MLFMILQRRLVRGGTRENRPGCRVFASPCYRRPTHMDTGCQLLWRGFGITTSEQPSQFTAWAITGIHICSDPEDIGRDRGRLLI